MTDLVGVDESDHHHRNRTRPPAAPTPGRTGSTSDLSQEVDPTQGAGQRCIAQHAPLADRIDSLSTLLGPTLFGPLITATSRSTKPQSGPGDFRTTRRSPL
jgi:hypothetical protein